MPYAPPAGTTAPLKLLKVVNLAFFSSAQPACRRAVQQRGDFVAAQCAPLQERISDDLDLTARCRDQTTGSKAQAANFFLIDTEQAERSSRLNVDLCDIARKLKVMRPWERLTLE